MHINDSHVIIEFNEHYHFKRYMNYNQSAMRMTGFQSDNCEDSCQTHDIM
jgi:hypothetical protein